MKIALNFGGATWLGGRYYLENLARALLQLGADLQPELTAVGSDDVHLPHVKQARAVPADADVIFPSWGVGASTAAAKLHWIPDLQHRELPHNFSLRERLRRDLGYRRLARAARLVVVSSEAVRSAAASAYGGSRSKLRVLHFRTVVPNAARADDPRATVERYELPDRFLLLPNQFWAHKNHEVAFAALDALPLPLVCTGATVDHRRPHFAESLLEDVRRRGLEERLHVLGVVPRADYLQLVRAASALVQPSLFEGWSSIVEDARAFGKPIALSDIAVHREQDPPRAFFFPPHDPAALAGAVAAAVDTGSSPEAESAPAQDVLVERYAEGFLAIAAEAVGTIRP